MLTGANLTALGLALTLVGILVSLFFPEVRRKLGLEGRPKKLSEKAASAAGELSTPPSALRDLHSVSLIRAAESGLPLPEMPTSSFGFVEAPYLILWRRPDKICVHSVQRSTGMEVHKLQNGKIEIVGYVGAETLTRIRTGLNKADKLTLYSHRWAEAPHLVSLPLENLEIIRHRMIQIANDLTHALDCIVR
jgi:hypothetical protein